MPQFVRIGNCFHNVAFIRKVELHGDGSLSVSLDRETTAIVVRGDEARAIRQALEGTPKVQAGLKDLPPAK